MDYQKASKKYDETYPNFLNTFTAEKTIKGAIGQSYDSIYDINPKAIKDCFGIIKSDFFCFKFEGVFFNHRRFLESRNYALVSRRHKTNRGIYSSNRRIQEKNPQPRVHGRDEVRTHRNCPLCRLNQSRRK